MAMCIHDYADECFCWELTKSELCFCDWCWLVRNQFKSEEDEDRNAAFTYWWLKQKVQSRDVVEYITCLVHFVYDGQWCRALFGGNLDYCLAEKNKRLR